MAEVEYGSKDKCTGFKQPATGTTVCVGKINKSCDSCLRAKRRCDHKLPCGRCMTRGNDHLCKYSRRKFHKSHRSQAKFTRQGAASSGGSMSTIVRARFSPSPATGLVGMKENAFLSDFFGALGFLPLTSESQIREIIVKMMACASGLVLKPGFNRPKGKRETHRGGLTIQNAELSDRVTGPSACILWSAIALGALAKGAPPKEVNGYCRMATAEVHGFSPWPAEAVGARVILGYVHAFLGDQEEFSRYFKLAGALMGACKEHGYKEPFPIGLAEIIQSDKSMSEFEISMEDMRTLSAETISPPEMSSYPSDAEVYRYIIAYNRAFVQTYARLFLSAAEAPERDGDRSDELGTTELPQNEGRLGMVSIRPDEVWKRLKDIPFDLDILEQAVTRRSSFGDGVGGAMINTLLSVAAAGEFDRQGLFEKTKQIVVLAERYPGMFRFAPWSHVPHYLAELLARMAEPETRTLYDMVRKANNLVRNDSLPEIPPFEEWRGVSAICDNPACRMAEDYVERLLAPTPYELSRGAMQEGFGVDDASSAEMLHHATRQTPGEKNRFTSHGEEIGLQDIGAVEVNSDIEIEMLSILANAEPDALEEALFSPTGSSDMEAFLVKPMERETIRPIDHDDRTRTDGEFLQAHSAYINARMGQGVSFHPVRFDGIHGADTAAEESVGAKDWLETINTIRDDTRMM